jgi:predicted AAA+ superfamily ATPase
LIKQSSESLAGRIAYYYLGGFTLHDVGKNQWNDLWFKGDFPRSFLASG